MFTLYSIYSANIICTFCNFHYQIVNSSLTQKSLLTEFVSHNYPTSVWKEFSALGVPTFTSNHVQLEARIEKLLQGCLLSTLVSGNAFHKQLDEATVTYQH